jgi:putative sigma-54 modulation protein
MNLTISGHHIDVTPAIRHHVEEKLVPIERHGDHITRIEVTLLSRNICTRQRPTFTSRAADLFASSESDDMYAAIDSLADKLDRQVIKHKEKHRGH